MGLSSAITTAYKFQVTGFRPFSLTLLLRWPLTDSHKTHTSRTRARQCQCATWRDETHISISGQCKAMREKRMCDSDRQCGAVSDHYPDSTLISVMTFGCGPCRLRLVPHTFERFRPTALYCVRIETLGPRMVATRSVSPIAHSRLSTFPPWDCTPRCPYCALSPRSLAPACVMKCVPCSSS